MEKQARHDFGDISPATNAGVDSSGPKLELIFFDSWSVGDGSQSAAATPVVSSSEEPLWEKGKPYCVEVGNKKYPIYYSVSGGKPYYAVCYKLPGSKKRNRPSFSTFEEAVEFAKTVPTLEIHARESRFQACGEEGLIIKRALRALEGRTETLDEVARSFASAMTKAEARMASIGLTANFDDMVNAYLRALPEKVIRLTALRDEMLRNMTIRDTSQVTRRVSSGQLVRFLVDRLGDIFIHLVTKKDLVAWMKAAGKPSVYRHQTALDLFHFAQDEGYLSQEIPTVADKFTRPKQRSKNDDPDATPAIFFPEQAERIIAWFWPDRKKESVRMMLLYFVLGCFTGIRPIELTRLTWERNFDFKRRIIMMQRSITKEGRPRVVPISDMLMAWLEVLKPEKLVGKCVKKQVAPGLIDMIEPLGIPWVKDIMRHSYATYQYAMGIDDETLARLLGNSRHIVHSNYIGVVAEPEHPLCYWSILPDGFAEKGLIYRGWPPRPGDTKLGLHETARRLLRAVGETFLAEEAYALFDKAKLPTARKYYPGVMGYFCNRGVFDYVRKPGGGYHSRGIYTKTAVYHAWDEQSADRRVAEYEAWGRGLAQAL